MPRSSLKFALIVNPQAGHYSSQRVQRFYDMLCQGGAHGLVYVTDTRQEALDCARASVNESSITHVIVAGGDGTLADIATELLGSSVVMCILPIGTANVLAHDLGVPQNDEQNAKKILQNRQRTLWPGLACDAEQTVLFLQMMGIGVDGTIVHHVSSRLKKWIGKYAYVLSAVRSLVWGNYPSFTVKIDGESHICQSVIISKGRFYGGPYRLVDETQHFYHYLTIIMIKRISLLAVCRLLLRWTRFKTIELPGASEVRVAKYVQIQSSPALLAQRDGDVSTVLPTDVCTADRAVLVGYDII